MAKRKKPLPKRWPGEWVFRGRVWDPAGESIETEGKLDDPIGPFIRTLMLLGFTSDRLLTPKVVGILERALKRVQAEIAAIKERDRPWP